MARLWRNNPETKGGKYLVVRRDGTIPEWAHFVLGERDINSVAALRAYADSAEKNQLDPLFVADIRAMADEWERNLESGVTTPGDPDAPRHREDDSDTVALMESGAKQFWPENQDGSFAFDGEAKS